METEQLLKRYAIGERDFHGSTLVYAELSGAQLAGVNLQAAILTEANLKGACLRQANLESTSLEDADLRDVDLQFANLKGANLCGASLVGANLSHANLSGANLESADLRQAELHGADFNGANLHRANLDSALVSNMVVELAIPETAFPEPDQPTQAGIELDSTGFLETVMEVSEPVSDTSSGLDLSPLSSPATDDHLPPIEAEFTEAEAIAAPETTIPVSDAMLQEIPPTASGTELADFFQQSASQPVSIDLVSLPPVNPPELEVLADSVNEVPSNISETSSFDVDLSSDLALGDLPLPDPSEIIEVEVTPPQAAIADLATSQETTSPEPGAELNVSEQPVTSPLPFNSEDRTPDNLPILETQIHQPSDASPVAPDTNRGNVSLTSSSDPVAEAPFASIHTKLPTQSSTSSLSSDEIPKESSNWLKRLFSDH